MEDNNRKSMIVCLITFILGVYPQVMLGTLNITVPGDLLTIGSLVIGNTINANLTWNLSSTLTIVIASNGVAIRTLSSSTSPFLFNQSITTAGYFTIKIKTLSGTPIPYELNAISQGVTYSLKNVAVSYNYQKFVHKFNIPTYCSEAAIYSSSSNLYTYFNSFRPSTITNAMNVDIGCFSVPYSAYIKMSSN